MTLAGPSKGVLVFLGWTLGRSCQRSSACENGHAEIVAFLETPEQGRPLQYGAFKTAHAFFTRPMRSGEKCQRARQLPEWRTQQRERERAAIATLCSL
jgi:hypothetical protein